MGHVDELYAAFAGIPLRLTSDAEVAALTERAFFAAQGADDQRAFSLALETLAFWAG